MVTAPHLGTWNGMPAPHECRVVKNLTFLLSVHFCTHVPQILAAFILPRRCWQSFHCRTAGN
jgi:hypothetical protein